MNDASESASEPTSRSASLSVLGRVDERCDRFESSWKKGERPRIEDALNDFQAADRPSAFRRLLALEIELRKKAGELPAPVDYFRRFPEWALTIRDILFGDDDRSFFDGAPDSTCSTQAVGATALDPTANQKTVADVSAPGDPFPVGTVIADHEIIDRLGRGGMGVVYRARHRRADRVVALKLIQPGQLAEIDEFQRKGILQRFQAESLAAAGLEHDHIVPVYDVGRAGDLPYYSMRLIEGGSLADRLRNGPVDCRQAADWLEPIARAVHYAHERQVLHRDIKPRNILIDSSNRALITDFGLVKRLDVPQAWRTLSGERLGTPSYMSPEQANGVGDVGPASDIYGLGATLYETLTGRPPFQAADPVQTLRLVIDAEPVSPRRLNPVVPKDLETICLKCLEKDPRRRYLGANALADDLRRWKNQEPITARPVGRIGCLIRWARRKPTLAAVSAALIAVAIVSTLAIAWQYRSTVMAQRALIDAHIAGLVRAEPTEIPLILADLETLAPSRVEVLGRLREMFDKSEPRGRRRVRAALALSRLDPARVDDALIGELQEEMLDADPRELILIRNALKPRAKRLRGDLWALVIDPYGDSKRAFRAACGLAELDPKGSLWIERGEDVAARLLGREGTRLEAWIEALMPIRDRLRPYVEKTFFDPSRPDRFVAAEVLAAFADRPEDLVRLVEHPETEARQIRTLLPRIREFDRARLISLLQDRLADLAESGEPDSAIQRRCAHLALVSLAMDLPEPAWRILKLTPDPEARSTLIHAFAPADIDPMVLIRRLEIEPDVSVRRALLLALGEYDVPPIARGSSSRGRGLFQDRLAVLYRDDTDPGIHAAVEWLARRWHFESILEPIGGELASTDPLDDRDWFVNRQGLAFAVVRPPVELEVSGFASPNLTMSIPSRRVRIGRSFAIGLHEIDEVIFASFLKDCPDVQPVDRVAFTPTSHADRAAVERADWLIAVKFCRWLSEREQIPEAEMCFPPISAINSEMELDKDLLSRSGYRLPTEAEWEYAARAGTSSPTFYGSSARLASFYAWTIENAYREARPSGLLKPNDLGLFDVLGNSCEWTLNGYDWFRRYPAASGIVEDIGDLVGKVHMRRGCSRQRLHDQLSIQERAPSHDYPYSGFRLARTIKQRVRSNRSKSASRFAESYQ